MVSGSSGGWTENTVGFGAATFRVLNLDPGTTYDFRIAAINGTESSSDVTTTLATWMEIEDWRFTNFGTTVDSGQAADSATPSGDGMQNLLKYALGLNATATSNSSHLITELNADKRLAITFQRARGDLIYTVQGSSDLSTWTDIAINPGSVGAGVTVTDTAAANEPRRFLRLKISR